jgi:hypothetical protein
MPAYSWTQAAEDGAQAAKIPAGQGVPVRIRKVVYTRKGKPMSSKQGDPQIGVIFEDEFEREAMQIVTLSTKAAWVLSRLLSRFGFNLEALERDGIEPHHFAQQQIGDQKLIGLRGKIDITYDGNGYADIVPCEVPDKDKSAPAKGAFTPAKPPAPPVQAGGQPMSEDDIPF